MSRTLTKVKSSPASSSKQLRDKTFEMLVEYKRNPSIKLRNRLVEMNIGLVRQIAHRISYQSLVPYEDLEQLGSLGLIRAIERFNAEQGYAFSSFAVPYIRGEMLHYLRDHSTLIRIPRRWQCLRREGQKLQHELIADLGRPPSDLEIATRMSISLKDWQAAKLSQMNHVPMSLDASVGSLANQPEALTLGELLPDHQESDKRQIEQDQMQLHKALAQLEDQTRQILEFIYLRNYTRKQTAAYIGVSPMTITRRVQKGIAQLNALMQD